MTDKHDDGGPAYPYWNAFDGYQQHGMSLRDWFAGQAMSGYMAGMPLTATYEEMAEKCYRAADAMIAARKEEKAMADGKKDDWRLIDDRPDRPTCVELFYGKIPHAPDCRLFDRPDARDERRSIGFFDGEEFCENGTGHECFEALLWGGDERWFPTHWRELGPVPSMETSND